MKKVSDTMWTVFRDIDDIDRCGLCHKLDHILQCSRRRFPREPKRNGRALRNRHASHRVSRLSGRIAGYHPTHAQHCRCAGRSSLALLVRDERQ